MLNKHSQSYTFSNVVSIDRFSNSQDFTLCVFYFSENYVLSSNYGVEGLHKCSLDNKMVLF